MKKFLLTILVSSLILSLALPAAASSEPPAIIVEGVTVSARVDKLQGNLNTLWITVTDSSGSKTESFTIANNAISIYPISTDNGDYQIYVATKGNTQIRACYIVSFSGRGRSAIALTDYSELDNAISYAEAFDEDEYTAESWAILAAAVENGKSYERNLPVSSQYYVDTLTKSILNAESNLAKKNSPEVFMNFTASVSEILINESYKVSFFAETADILKPQDGTIYVYCGQNVLLVLYDNGRDADDIAGDNIYSGTADISFYKEGIIEFHAEANSIQSKPFFINVNNQ